MSDASSKSSPKQPTAPNSDKSKSKGAQEGGPDLWSSLSKDKIKDTKEILAKKLGRDPTPAEVAQYLKTHSKSAAKQPVK